MKLREAIVAGEFQPNERLIEAELSQNLGASRAAIRNALMLLERDGLVTRELNRGAKVRLIGTDEALEILEAREALEGVIGRHAALNATDADLKDLDKTMQRMQELLDKGDLLGLSDESGVLHGRLLDIAQHETVSRLLATLKSQMVRFQFRTILVPGRPDAAFAEHTAIIEAIRAREPEAAEIVTRQHVSKIREALEHDLNVRGRGDGRH